MCGIVGQVNSDQVIDVECFDAMRDTLAHRGPDGWGSEVLDGGRVALGHRRLAIIDLSERARQPMSNEDGTVWLTFNGEIYNFAELRSRLESAGHRFRSRSDSEVLVHGYEQWGRGVLSRLRGMFAFAIWDTRRRVLFAARDRFGIKPFYYYFDGRRLIFASELKAIVADRTVPRTLDDQALLDFLVYRFIPAPRSIWKDASKLPAGHWLEHRPGSVPRVQRYWNIETERRRLPEAEIVEQAGALIDRSVREQLTSDVPVGVLLSGGFDSSTIAHAAHRQGYPLRTYTIDFKGWRDSEHESARTVADLVHARHCQQPLGEGMAGLAGRLAYYYDEPLGGSSFLPMFIVSRLASRDVKVVLAGDGGDEVFAGYRWHRSIYDAWLGMDRRARWWQRMRRGVPFLVQAYFDEMSWAGFTYATANRLLASRVPGPSLPPDTWLYRRRYRPRDGALKALQLFDYQTFMTDLILAKVDRASMANSLEVRVPMLDHELTEFMMGLDETQYYRPDRNKHILYEIVKPYFPDSILRKPKLGFGAPIKRFLKRDLVENDLRGGRLWERHLVDRGCVDACLRHNNRSQLWALYILEQWARTWL